MMRRRNTRRMNRLEELGRVDAEKAFTKKGARNLREEKKRIVGELKKADGGKVRGRQKAQPTPRKPKAPRDQAQQRRMGGGLKKVQPHQKGLKKLPTKVRNKMGYMKKGGKVGMGKAMRGGGCVR